MFLDRLSRRLGTPVPPARTDRRGGVPQRRRPDPLPRMRWYS